MQTDLRASFEGVLFKPLLQNVTRISFHIPRKSLKSVIGPNEKYEPIIDLSNVLVVRGACAS